jgi:hypothetical protein
LKPVPGRREMEGAPHSKVENASMQPSLGESSGTMTLLGCELCYQMPSIPKVRGFSAQLRERELLLYPGEVSGTRSKVTPEIR